MRRRARAAHPSPAPRPSPQARKPLRPAASASTARSFLQGHGELAEGVEKQAEAARPGTAPRRARLAPHRAGPALPPPPSPRPPGRTGTEGRHRAAAGATSSSSATASHPPHSAPSTTFTSAPTPRPGVLTPPPAAGPSLRAGGPTRRRTEREGGARLVGRGVRSSGSWGLPGERLPSLQLPTALQKCGERAGRWRQLTQFQIMVLPHGSLGR